MAVWSFGLLVLLTAVFCPLYVSTTGSNQFHGTMPELFFANVAGKIKGGLDVIVPGDQTRCGKRSREKRRYREIDGRCNHPLDYGSTMKPVKRYLRAHYQDKMGMDAPRTFSVKGGALLPSPRSISRRIHTDRPIRGPQTLWLVQLGQFIDHDITSAPVPTEHNSSIQCCGIPIHLLRPECFPIIIPPYDPVFRSCMEFVRSEPVRDKQGFIKFPREQMNALTSFIDASSIYGSDAKNLRELRTKKGKGALLKTNIVAGKERLPRDPNPDINECSVSKSPQSYCQLSGDLRVNEQPCLGSAHLLFHLFHNYIARSITRGFLAKRGLANSPAAINRFLRRAPHPLQERIFQESRKIVGAVLQKITYCDWLPLIVGAKLIRKYNLGCHDRSLYNPYKDPRIANVFLSAAFRFGHSMIPNIVKANNMELALRTQFMIPDANLRFFESIVQGMQEKDSAMKFDRHVSSALTNHLFESSKGPAGALDLISLNIQRGRDHGIPAYHFWREYYGLPRLTRFSQFSQKSDVLKRLYKHILDVDLFVGGLLESPVEGGVVGETFGNIIANQFSDIKEADAFFFTRYQTLQGFSDDQLLSIMTYSLRDIICTIAEIDSAQVNVFLEPSPKNRVQSCLTKEEFDITPWLKHF